MSPFLCHLSRTNLHQPRVQPLCILLHRPQPLLLLLHLLPPLPHHAKINLLLQLPQQPRTRPTHLPHLRNARFAYTHPIYQPEIWAGVFSLFRDDLAVVYFFGGELSYRVVGGGGDDLWLVFGYFWVKDGVLELWFFFDGGLEVLFSVENVSDLSHHDFWVGDACYWWLAFPEIFNHLCDSFEMLASLSVNIIHDFLHIFPVQFDLWSWPYITLRSDILFLDAIVFQPHLT